jgi:hypothetical protein
MSFQAEYMMLARALAALKIIHKATVAEPLRQSQLDFRLPAQRRGEAQLSYALRLGRI